MSQPFSIQQNPDVPFYAIINPSSGPGSAGTQPGPEYQQCIPQLLEPANVVVLGYVASWEGVADMQAGVRTDVNTYAGWAASYRVKGIFFDEVSGQAADFATYTNFTSTARSRFSFVSHCLV